MIHDLLPALAGNAVVALVLAVGAVIAQRQKRGAPIAHVLWVLVLAKLLTPPLFDAPLIVWPGADEKVAEAETLPLPLDDELALPISYDAAALEAFTIDEPVVAEEPQPIVSLSDALLSLWLAGSLVMAAWSLHRILRFRRLLAMSETARPKGWTKLFAQTARRVGLKTTPRLITTTARLSPMVWWLGGRSSVIVPADLEDGLNRHQLRLVLAHELTHVRRGDHMVRWLEWMACVVLWWNPLVWFARRNLRANEELCCDASVLDVMNPGRREYAASLMAVVEFLAVPVIRPPALASELTSGGFLERRFEMIVSESALRTTPRWALALIALIVLPIGIATGQSTDEESKTVVEEKRLVEGVPVLEELPIVEGVGTFREVPLLEGIPIVESANTRRGKSDEKRLTKMMREAGLSDDKIEHILAAMKRILAAVDRGEKVGTATAGLPDLLIKLGLTERQDAIVQEAVTKIVTRASNKKTVEGRHKFDELRRRFEQVLENADMSPEVGRRLAELQRARDAQRREKHIAALEALKTDLMNEVQGGRLSWEVVEKKLYEAQRKFREDDRRRLEMRALVEQQLHDLEAKLNRFADAADLSEDDARLKYEKARRDVLNRYDRERSESALETDRRRAHAKYVALEKSIEKAVAEGRLSREEGLRKLEASRVKMSESLEKKRYEERRLEKRSTSSIKEEIEQAVREGKLSRLEAEKKLLELHQQQAVDLAKKLERWSRLRSEITSEHRESDRVAAERLHTDAKLAELRRALEAAERQARDAANFMNERDAENKLRQAELMRRKVELQRSLEVLERERRAIKEKERRLAERKADKL